MDSFGDIVCGVRALLHVQLSVQPRPILRRGVVERSDKSAVFNAPRCSAAARNGGRRRHKPDLSNRGCYSGGRGRFSWKNGQYGGPPFRFFRESCFRETDRAYFTMARAENDGNGIEEETTYDHEDDLRPPITVKNYVKSANVDFYLQVVIFVLAAGFVDAGFSGDWSRIGVLSKQTEEELQMAAVGVVPLAATLIWSISQRMKKL